MIPFPKKKYKIIYADPPWKYKVWAGKGKTAENHYHCMSLEDIKTLPVQDIAANDCVLFLWITPPCLSFAFEVMRSWGFEYKTIGFIWIKKNKKANSLFMGLGYWTRANGELCLIATRGHPKSVSRSVRQVIVSPLREHSRKPDEARERIVQLMGDIPRIELFARQRVEGWDCWGDEAPETGDEPS